MAGLGTVSNGGVAGVGASGINAVEPPDYSESSILIMLTTLIAHKISEYEREAGIWQSKFKNV